MSRSVKAPIVPNLLVKPVVLITLDALRFACGVGEACFAGGLVLAVVISKRLRGIDGCGLHHRPATPR